MPKFFKNLFCVFFFETSKRDENCRGKRNWTIVSARVATTTITRTRTRVYYAMFYSKQESEVSNASGEKNGDIFTRPQHTHTHAVWPKTFVNALKNVRVRFHCRIDFALGQALRTIAPPIVFDDNEPILRHSRDCILPFSLPTPRIDAYFFFLIRKFFTFQCPSPPPPPLSHSSATTNPILSVSWRRFSRRNLLRTSRWSAAERVERPRREGFGS